MGHVRKCFSDSAKNVASDENDTYGMKLKVVFLCNVLLFIFNYGRLTAK